MVIPQVLNIWVVAERALDVEGQWVAHCLEFDVVSQGDSLAHAIDMVAEAVEMVAREDLASGRNPHARRAPEEDWQELYRLLREGTAGDIQDVVRDESKVNSVATVIELRAALRVEDRASPQVAWRENRQVA